jgi:hypothetical protein
MRKWIAGALFAAAQSFLPVGDLYANSIAQSPGSENPAPFDIYLLTVGIGDQIYARFGHTMIRVVDRNGGSDAVYNWGMFDYADPGFAWKFFKGILLYRVGVQSFSRTMTAYQYEQRPVWQERLNLTPVQTRRLLDRIALNMRPENIRYPYQYFFNNCATKPRDYIDEAVGGVIKATYAQELSGRTHRWYVREYLNDNPLVGLGLDVLMNGDIDRPVSKWDEMFFPPKLREYLRVMPALDDSGKPLQGVHLLSRTEELLTLPDAPSGDRNSFVYAQVLFGFPILFFFVAMIGVGGLRRVLTRNEPEQWSGRVAWATLDAGYNLLARIALACLGAGLAGWSILSGVFGTLHVTMWLLSAHTDTHHNANLWLFWPTDFLFAIVGWRSLRNALRGRLKRRPILGATVRFYAGLHLVALVTMVTLRQSGYIQQDVDRVLYNMGILAAWIYTATWFGMMDFDFDRKQLLVSDGKE